MDSSSQGVGMNRRAMADSTLSAGALRGHGARNSVWPNRRPETGGRLPDVLNWEQQSQEFVRRLSPVPDHRRECQASNEEVEAATIKSPPAALRKTPLTEEQPPDARRQQLARAAKTLYIFN